MTQSNKMTRAAKLIAATATLAIVAMATPISIKFSWENGVTITSESALAKSGSGRDGDGRDNDRDDDNDRDNDRDDDRGGARDRDDDRSNDRDDNRNNGRNNASGVDRSNQRAADRRRGRERNDRGPRAEIQGNNVEVTFADGTKQEIEFGRFEQKDAFGNTVVERPATAADRSRLETAANDLGRSIGKTVGTRNVTKAEISGQDIKVTFANGTKQEIEFGRFEQKDAFGNTVIERPATQADRARLQNAANYRGRAINRNVGSSQVTKTEVAGQNIEVRFADGTKQEIEFGRFEQKDAFGNTVIERPATQADRTRLEAAAHNFAGSVGRSFLAGGGTQTQTVGQNIEVTFTDGTRQEIEFGRLEVKDMFGATIVERPATADDFNRLASGISTLR